MKKNKGWAWFVHHARLLEYCRDYAGRVEYIKIGKLKSEVPTRLLAFQFCKGKLPSKLLKAYAVREKARAACTKPIEAYTVDSYAFREDDAYAVCRNAYAAYDKIYTACLPQLAKMFCKEHPDVAWDKETETLLF